MLNVNILHNYTSFGSNEASYSKQFLTIALAVIIWAHSESINSTKIFFKIVKYYKCQSKNHLLTFSPKDLESFL